MHLMLGRNRAWKLLGSMAIVIAFFLSVPLASASAPPSPPAVPSGSTSWAYGGTWVWDCSTVSCMGSTANNTTVTGYTEHVHIYMGVDVIYIQTNTSTGTSLEVYASVVAAAFLSVTGTCQGTSCGPGASYNVNANLTARGYIVEIGYANVTTGTVYSNGTTLQALALQDAGSHEQANFTAAYSVSAGTSASTENFYGYAALQIGENSSVSFTPALGLFPINPTPGENWTSNATYTASGGANFAEHAYFTAPVTMLNTTGGTNCPTGYQTSGLNCVFTYTNGATTSIAGAGALNLYGSDLGSTTVTLPDGTVLTCQILQISTVGEFGFTQGVVLVPNSVATGTSSGPGGIPLPASVKAAVQPATTIPQAITTTSGETMVFHPDYSGHDGISILSSSQGSMPGKGPDAGMSNPITVSQAQADSQTNMNMVTGGGNSPSSGMNYLVFVLIAVVVAVVAIVGVVAWSGRRKRRATAAPPPGMMASPAPGAYAPPAGVPPPPMAPYPPSGPAQPQQPAPQPPRTS